MDLRVYLVNLGTYVEGNPVGAWFKLPIGSEEEAAEKLKLDKWQEEFAIHGHEGFPRHMKMPGCCTVSGLNNMYEELSELEDRNCQNWKIGLAGCWMTFLRYIPI